MTLAGFTPGTPAFRAEMDAFARLVESQYKLPSGMLSRMMLKESQYDPNAIQERTQAAGIVQQRPMFVRDMAQRFKYVFDPYNPRQALVAAAKYLAYIYRVTNGEGWDLPLIAYNYGEGNMRAYLKAKALYGNAKLPRETISYIAAIAPETLRG